MSNSSHQTNIVSRSAAKRYYVLTAAVAVAFSSIGWVTGNKEKRSDEISCRKLMLKDASGADRIVLAVKKKGPVITMMDAEGITRIEIMLDDRMGLRPKGDGSISSIRLYDRSGNANIWMRSLDYGETTKSGAAMGMSNGTESGHAGIGVDKDGQSTFTLRGDKSGINARNIRDDASQITILDSKGKIRMSLVGNSEGDKFWLEVNNKEGKELWRAP